MSQAVFSFRLSGSDPNDGISATVEAASVPLERVEYMVRQFARMVDPECPLDSKIDSRPELRPADIHIHGAEFNLEGFSRILGEQFGLAPGHGDIVAMSGGEEDGELSADEVLPEVREVFGDKLIDDEDVENGDEGFYDAETETVGVGLTITADEVSAKMAENDAAPMADPFPPGWTPCPDGRVCAKGHPLLVSPSGHRKCRICLVDGAASAAGRAKVKAFREVKSEGNPETQNQSPHISESLPHLADALQEIPSHVGVVAPGSKRNQFAATVRDSVDPPETAPSDSPPPELDSPEIDAQIRKGMLSPRNDQSGKFLIVRRDKITFWANKHLVGAELVAEVVRDADMKWRKRLPGSTAAGTIVLPV